MGKPFVVTCDASGRVVEYENLKLREHEEHYPTHDLELATIVHALKHWRHFLLGVKFKL